MRKHRFFVSQPLHAAQTLVLDADLTHYINNVLRLRNDDQIFLFNNTEHEFAAVIKDIKRNAITAQIIDIIKVQRESSLEINLGQVLCKGSKFDLIIQKATELGVHSITPLYSEHSVIRPVSDRQETKVGHWQKIAVAASCQSWRNIVPEIYPPQSLTNWLKEDVSATKLILSPTAHSNKLTALQITSPVSILIGPEGGFSDNEIALAMQHNFQPISLGPRILRTETAGLATIAILQSQFGDM